MRQLPLTQGAVALVDDGDFDALAVHKWSLHSCGYAHRGEVTNHKARCVLMHRQIMGASAGQFVDHIDGNRLNNTRANLRLCSMSQNMANSGRRAHKRSSRFKGAFPSRGGPSWRASIKVNGKSIHLGYFSTDEEAARAYDRAAVHHFGEFASLNFPASPKSAA